MRNLNIFMWKIKRVPIPKRTKIALLCGLILAHDFVEDHGLLDPYELLFSILWQATVLVVSKSPKMDSAELSIDNSNLN